MQRELYKTADGSFTLKVPEIDEHYHSTFGALQESQHVYIQGGLDYAEKWIRPLNVLEIGFGTGLNALLTYQYANQNKRKINYVGIEPFPVETELLNRLNYPLLFEDEQYEEVFEKLHLHQASAPLILNDNFIFHRLEERIQEVELMENAFHVCYYDAFAPEKQSEMWSPFLFEKIANAMCDQGALVTYCAKGSVKRGLKEAGFKVERIDGPPGKRQMIRAIRIR